MLKPAAPSPTEGIDLINLTCPRSCQLQLVDQATDSCTRGWMLNGVLPDWS